MYNLKMFPLLMRFSRVGLSFKCENKLKVVTQKDQSPWELEMTTDFQVSMETLTALESQRKGSYLEDLNFSILNPMVGTIS